MKKNVICLQTASFLPDSTINILKEYSIVFDSIQLSIPLENIAFPTNNSWFTQLCCWPSKAIYFKVSCRDRLRTF
jgi:hypothetical protein